MDPRIGTWKLVAAQSTEDPPNKLVITSMPNAVHVAMTGEVRLDFTASTNGKPAPAPSNPAFDQVEVHRAGRTQVEVREEKAGAVVAIVREKLSKDGSELISTTVAPGRSDRVTVWTRNGAKAPKDPFAGEWVEDLSKTRLSQGLTLKIDPDGAGGVRFSGDDSYTAHLDGKANDVKGSRNDSVQLSMVDPHTVTALYKRDQQVTQRDRWVVTPDGHTMTLTSSATLETGQHITERLSFQKQ